MNERLVGQTVYDADGRELGKVKEVRGRYVKVDVRMQPDYWLSTDAVSSAGDRLVVSSDAQRVEHPDFEETEPRAGTAPTHERTSTAPLSTGTPRPVSGAAQEHEQQSVQLREERPRVETRQEQAGEVRLGKQVTEREETVNVPVREERVVVERTPAAGQPARGEITDSDQTLEMPLTRERPVVEKETVVAEEVNVRKETTERPEQVQTTLRKEELDVEEGGNITTEQPRRP